MRRTTYLAAAFAMIATGRPLFAEGSCGTAIEFVDSPKEAATLAKKEEKLVFILHVSGHFEDPRFT
ncbi:MAG: hypothetical protein ACJ8F7_09815 [Gemmataceae bacterium]